ncbi:MAG TPA: hypothetical protein VFX02_11010 [Gammaproteobacteria bacterium]|nr:hypothetical protein [Gammaproteobacteria bacterium]
MNADDKAQWFQEGARMIIDYCNMLAVRIGIDLKKIYWSSSESAEHLGKHLLIIEAEAGVIQLLFAPHDITTFPTKEDYSARTQRKLQKALFGFRT